MYLSVSIFQLITIPQHPVMPLLMFSVSWRISLIQFHIIIGGDFNVDLNVSSYRNSVLDDFFHERNFICMTCFPPPVLIIIMRVMLAELILGLTTLSVTSHCY